MCSIMCQPTMMNDSISIQCECKDTVDKNRGLAGQSREPHDEAHRNNLASAFHNITTEDTPQLSLYTGQGVGMMETN